MTHINPLSILFITLLFVLTACGGGGSSSEKIVKKEGVLTVNGKLLAGIDYRSGETTGITDTNGAFKYEKGKNISFSLDSESLGKLPASTLDNNSTITLTQIINSDTDPRESLKALPELYKKFETNAKYIQSPTYLTLINSQEEKILTLNNKPVTGIEYRSGSRSGTTDNFGLFNYEAGNNIAFSIAGKHIGSVSPNNLPISIEKLVENADNPVIKHLPLLLTDLNAENATHINARFNLNQLEQALFKPASLPIGRSLGINLETPQAEADGIYQPLPFVDIFRVARPFMENSCTDISYDRAGWPLDLPASCASQGAKKYAMTRILQFMPSGGAPSGRYHVLFEGKGNIDFFHMGSHKKQLEEGHLTIDIKPLPKTQYIHGLEVFITKTDVTDPIRNIRIIMPGGICKGSPFTRVETANQCSNDNPYISFVDVLKNNREAIIFNPDFLAFHKDFRVLRMMNFMEATPRRPASNNINPCPNNDSYNDCLTRDRSWNQIAKMSDASWGGSHKTIVTKRFGVPLEVTVALANLLKAHPWYTLPFNASDDYIDRYASYLKNNLDKSLKAHIEYSNEVWNGGFWGAQYAVVMGKKLGLDKPVLPFRTEEHSARVRFYSKRSVEIFKHFETVFGNLTRLVRIMGGQHKSHSYSREILSYNNAADETDVLAVAPYFHGCWSRTKAGDSETPIAACNNTDVVEKTLVEAKSVDDVFTTINSIYTPTAATAGLKGDTNSIDAITKLMTNQINTANEFDVDLYTYEGGQHLTVNYGDTTLSQQKMNSLHDLFAATNRDPRMGDLYTKFLNEWKDRGGKQFMLFTSPQSFNRYGFFGIKEYINQPRAEAPKYNAAMSFQEAMGDCWWTGC
ncbi:MAG TPA: hypothetical protein ENJ51_06485 [Leucothrix mucor]|uniref:Uncharacterized protein n=1 Tax=Leucothrix mucor TaxID=45248 RepID=A0A7V2SZM6_LEUMU|nr:hypothetical protein [Leucothrix mucor]